MAGPKKCKTGMCLGKRLIKNDLSELPSSDSVTLAYNWLVQMKCINGDNV